MKGLLYIVLIWLIGVLVSPALIFVFFGLKEEFFSFYLVMVVIGGMFSLITEVVLIGVYYLLILPNFKTVFSIKLATNITVVILIFLTFIFLYYGLDIFNTGLLIIVLPYIITMSVAVCVLKLDIQKQDKDDIPFIDDEVL